MPPQPAGRSGGPGSSRRARRWRAAAGRGLRSLTVSVSTVVRGVKASVDPTVLRRARTFLRLRGLASPSLLPQLRIRAMSLLTRIRLGTEAARLSWRLPRKRRPAGPSCRMALCVTTLRNALGLRSNASVARLPFPSARVKPTVWSWASEGPSWPTFCRWTPRARPWPRQPSGLAVRPPTYWTTW